MTVLIRAQQQGDARDAARLAVLVVRGCAVTLTMAQAEPKPRV